MDHTSQEFTVKGIRFRVSFGDELGFIIASVQSLSPGFEIMASVLTMAWKLSPVQLLNGLKDKQSFSLGEFFTISFNDNPDDTTEPLGVNLYEDENELNLEFEFFEQVVMSLAQIHIRLAGIDHFPWFCQLRPDLKNEILQRLQINS